MSKNECLKTELVVKMIHDGTYTIEQLAEMAKLPSVSDCLNEMIGRQNRPVKVSAELADIHESTLHKILSNKLNPSRNMLIRLALSLEMSFDETQVLLKSGNCAPLSGNRKRDLYLIDGLDKKKSLADVNKALAEHGYATLDAKG